MDAIAYGLVLNDIMDCMIGDALQLEDKTLLSSALQMNQTEVSLESKDSDAAVELANALKHIFRDFFG